MIATNDDKLQMVPSVEQAHWLLARSDAARSRSAAARARSAGVISRSWAARARSDAVRSLTARIARSAAAAKDQGAALAQTSGFGPRRTVQLRHLCSCAWPQDANGGPGNATRDTLAVALTDAELRLLPLLTTHLSFPEIGQELSLSLHTIKSHMKSIYRKLGASTRNEAVTRARELGLLEDWLITPPIRPGAAKSAQRVIAAS